MCVCRIDKELAGLEAELTGLKSRAMELTLNVICGVNVTDRSDCGILAYHSGRLMRLYDKCARQDKAADPMSVQAAGGVVTVVCLPSGSMPLALHLQDFATSGLYETHPCMHASVFPIVLF